MKRKYQLIIFITIIFIILFSIHLYVFFRISFMLEIHRNYFFFAILLFLSTFFIISNILIRYFYNIFTKALYAISATWIGVIFLLLFSLLLYEPIRILSSIPEDDACLFIIALVLIITIYSIYNAQKIQIKNIKIPFPIKLNAVLLSDLHIGTIHNRNYLKKVVEKVNSLQSDVIFITGDIISGSSKLRKNMFNPLKELNNKVFFVPGNHEFYEGIEHFLSFFNDTDIRVLRNESIDFNNFQIIGIDYSLDSDQHKKLFHEKVLSDNKPLIVLQHEPRYINSPNINLILSGHTHGGQVYPFNFIIRLFNPYVKGLYKINNSYLYVSSGTGTWGPPMRLGSKNEITLLQLGY